MAPELCRAYQWSIPIGGSIEDESGLEVERARTP
jgi:hypothetical protein